MLDYPSNNQDYLCSIVEKMPREHSLPLTKKSKDKLPVNRRDNIVSMMGENIKLNLALNPNLKLFDKPNVHLKDMSNKRYENLIYNGSSTDLPSTVV